MQYVSLYKAQVMKDLTQFNLWTVMSSAISAIYTSGILKTFRKILLFPCLESEERGKQESIKKQSD
jgi:hypothetical protein